MPGELPSQRELHSSFKDVVARSSLPSVLVNGTAVGTTATTTSSKLSRSSSSKNVTKARSSSHGISKKRESKRKLEAFDSRPSVAGVILVNFLAIFHNVMQQLRGADQLVISVAKLLDGMVMRRPAQKFI